MPADRNSLSAALRAALSDHGDRAARPFRDGRFLVACPSPEEARGLESIEMLHLPWFSVSFEQWSPDMGVRGKADGEGRWVVLRDIPLFCWHHDVIAKLVEPVGELIFADKRSPEFVDDVRASIRVRRGRELPSIIRASIGSCKHEVTIILERGQAILPWSKAQGPEHGPSPPARSLHPGNEIPERLSREGAWTREEKGKAPTREGVQASRGRDVRRITGIIIHEGGRWTEKRDAREHRGDRHVALYGPTVAEGNQAGPSRTPAEGQGGSAALSAGIEPGNQSTEGTGHER